MTFDKFKQEDGSYEIEGVHYDDSISVLGEMCDFCGCGDNLTALKYIAQHLQWIKDRFNDTISFEEWEKKFSSLGEAYLVLYFLDDKNFTEHGSSVWGSWLTEKGENFIADVHELTQNTDQCT